MNPLSRFRLRKRTGKDAIETDIITLVVGLALLVSLLAFLSLGLLL